MECQQGFVAVAQMFPTVSFCHVKPKQCFSCAESENSYGSHLPKLLWTQCLYFCSFEHFEHLVVFYEAWCKTHRDPWDERLFTYVYNDLINFWIGKYTIVPWMVWVTFCLLCGDSCARQNSASTQWMNPRQQKEICSWWRKQTCKILWVHNKPVGL